MRYLRVITFASLVFALIATSEAGAALVAAPHATVAGKTLSDWSAEWWQTVFALPVYASDGTTITHPQFDAGLKEGDTVDTDHARPSSSGDVTFLFGSFFGGDIDRTVTVPAGKPIFVPIANTEWSNPDTAPPPDYTAPPGNYTQAELAAFAAAQADTFTDLAASLDGEAIPDLIQHREAAQFTYTLPAERGIIETFFGLTDVEQPVESATDGYYLMLLPLEPGEHTLTFSASSPDNTATPPLLGAFTVNTTYHINVTGDGGGGAVIPLPAGVWLGLTVLPMSLRSVLRRRGRGRNA